MGEYLIPVGDKYGAFDHLVYIKGTNNHPIIRQIVEINEVYRKDDEKIVTEVMEDESTGLYYDAFEIYGAYAGGEIFTVHKAVDYPSYSELKNEGRGGRVGEGTDENNRERNDRTGVSGFGREKVRSEDAEEISDFEADANGTPLADRETHNQKKKVFPKNAEETSANFNHYFTQEVVDRLAAALEPYRLAMNAQVDRQGVQWMR